MKVVLDIIILTTGKLKQDILDYIWTLQGGL